MKNIIIWSCIILIVTIIVLPLLSSFMQSYYKSQLESLDKEPEGILNRKNFWSKLGEPITLLYVFIFEFLLFLVVFLIHLVKR